METTDSLLTTPDVVSRINAAGWVSIRGTAMTAERLRVIRQTGGLGGFPDPTSRTSGGWPLWTPTQVDEWLSRQPIMQGLLSTHQVRQKIRRRDLSMRAMIVALQEACGDPVSHGGRFFWPADAPGRVRVVLRKTTT